MTTEAKPRKGYWYKHFTTECPVCGRGDSWKERQYTPKPTDPQERWVWKSDYDWCNAL